MSISSPAELFDTRVSYTLTSMKKQHWVIHGFSYKKEPRPDHGIMFLFRGKIDFHCADRIVSANVGDIVYIPKGCCYEAVFRIEGSAVEDFLVNFDTVGGQPTLQEHACPCIIVKNANHRYFELFERLTESDWQSPHTPFRDLSRFYELLAALCEDGDSPASTAEGCLHVARQLLSDEQELSVREIAKQCCVSESGLRNLFQKSMGLSPTQFRLHSKIGKAKYLLESTDLSIKDIADALHFYDVAYFCKCFHRAVGVTPKQYARNQRL